MGKFFATLIFICIQMFFYSALCMENTEIVRREVSLQHLTQEVFAPCVTDNGAFVKNQSDIKTVCQNLSLKCNLQRLFGDGSFASHYALVPSDKQFQALLKYILDNSNLKNKNTHLVFLGEINTRAP